MASDQFLAVIGAAKHWGVLPSSLLRIEDPVLALNFDLAATARSVKVIEEMQEQQEQERAGGALFTLGDDDTLNILKNAH